MDEAYRLEAVQTCDPQSSDSLDAITRLATSLFDVPVSMVSIIKEMELHFISICPGGAFEPCATRQGSFCEATIATPHPQVLIVEDATQDARFSSHRYVAGEPYFRFYAASPLLGSSGARYGTLCIMDYKPRNFPSSMYNILVNLSEVIVRQLEAQKYHALERLVIERSHSGLLRTMESFDFPMMMVDTSVPWKICCANTAWGKLLGTGNDKDYSNCLFWDVFSPATDSPEAITTLLHAAAPHQRRVLSTVRYKKRVLPLLFKHAAADTLDDSLPIGIPSLVDEEGPGVAGREQGSSFWLVVPESQPSLSSSGSGNLVPLQFDLTQPKELSELELGPFLGRGSYGRVFRARWHGVGVAVKIIDCIDNTLLTSAGNAKGALLEACLSRSLAHPNIIQTFEYKLVKYEGQDDDDVQFSDPDIDVGLGGERQQIWIIQEYCNRGTLGDAIDRGWLRQERSMRGPPNMKHVLATAVEIASVLQYLHSKDIVHGDLSPNNVLLRSSGKDTRRFSAVVCDFGLSVILTGTLTPFQQMGTVSHTAPEVMEHGKMSTAADAYAFGVLLWEMYCGAKAWQGYRATQVMHAVTSGATHDALKVPEDAPDDVKGLLVACLERDPAKRLNMQQVLKILLDMQKVMVQTRVL